MKVTVIGCGRWGSLIAWYLYKQGHKVALYGRGDSPRMQRLINEGGNEYISLPKEVALTTDITSAADAKVILISVNSQGLRGLIGELNKVGIKNKVIVLCMKGLEKETGMRLSEVASAGLDGSNKIAVWLGPGHVQEFYAGIPNCMVIDSADDATKRLLVDSFSSSLIRFYYGNDLIGNEIGAAAKNVVGIAAGMLDGLGLTSLKGALMSRGTREVARLIKAMGGSELSAYGLCHLGDYEATVFSEFSHNRRFGEFFVLKKPFDSLAEGYYTVKAIIKLGERFGVELPICGVVYKALYEDADVRAELDRLFERTIKNEF
ncbi:MAG: NAD(P)-binding domain-containing protein [Ruminococcaceae bacterium]|nr:NAD(P)-binding domain-containing protein [Oscillospiraceae bacterium]